MRQKNKFRVRASWKKTFTNCIIWVLKYFHLNVDLRVWLRIAHKMHIMRDCVDAIWYSMTPSWTFLWAISSHFQILMNRKSVLCARVHCCQIFLSCERKLNKNDKKEERKMVFATFVSEKQFATILADDFFWILACVPIYLRFILS